MDQYTSVFPSRNPRRLRQIEVYEKPEYEDINDEVDVKNLTPGEVPFNPNDPVLAEEINTKMTKTISDLLNKYAYEIFMLPNPGKCISDNVIRVPKRMITDMQSVLSNTTTCINEVEELKILLQGREKDENDMIELPRLFIKKIGLLMDRMMYEENKMEIEEAKVAIAGTTINTYDARAPLDYDMIAENMEKNNEIKTALNNVITTVPQMIGLPNPNAVEASIDLESMIHSENNHVNTNEYDEVYNALKSMFSATLFSTPLHQLPFVKARADGTYYMESPIVDDMWVKVYDNDSGTGNGKMVKYTGSAVQEIDLKGLDVTKGIIQQNIPVKTKRGYYGSRTGVQMGLQDVEGIGNIFKNIWGAVKRIKLPSASQIDKALKIIKTGTEVVGGVVATSMAIKNQIDAKNMIINTYDNLEIETEQNPKVAPGKMLLNIMPNVIKAGYNKIMAEEVPTDVIRDVVVEQHEIIKDTTNDTSDSDKVKRLVRKALLSSKKRFASR